MNTVTILKTLLCVGTCFIISACNYQEIPIKLVYSSNDCAINTQTLQSINNKEELRQLLETKPRRFSAASPSLPEIDYDKQSLLIFALGQKPSSGYSIQLYVQHALLHDNKLYLPVRINKPEKNSLQAQVLTSPCQLYSIPKTEFDEVLLADTENIAQEQSGNNS